MAEVLGLAHIGIFVKDIEKSKKFYKDVLGLDCIEQCVLETDDNTFTCGFVKKGSVCLELVQRKIGENPGDGMTDHVAYAVDDLDAMKAELIAKGIKFETEETQFCKHMFSDGTKWIFFRGPDDEHIELTQIL